MLGIKRNTGYAILLFCGVGLATADVRAQDLGNGWTPNALELARLPDYCQKFFLEKKTPPNCDGVHHLCAGKVLINRVSDYSIPKTERQRILRRAKDEVSYIFGRKNAQCEYMGVAEATLGQIRTLEIIVR